MQSIFIPQYLARTASAQSADCFNLQSSSISIVHFIQWH